MNLDDTLIAEQILVYILHNNITITFLKTEKRVYALFKETNVWHVNLWYKINYTRHSHKSSFFRNLNEYQQSEHLNITKLHKSSMVLEFWHTIYNSRISSQKGQKINSLLWQSSDPSIIYIKRNVGAKEASKGMKPLSQHMFKCLAKLMTQIIPIQVWL